MHSWCSINEANVIILHALPSIWTSPFSLPLFIRPPPVPRRLRSNTRLFVRSFLRVRLSDELLVPRRYLSLQEHLSSLPGCPLQEGKGGIYLIPEPSTEPRRPQTLSKYLLNWTKLSSNDPHWLEGETGNHKFCIWSWRVLCDVGRACFLSAPRCLSSHSTGFDQLTSPVIPGSGDILKSPSPTACSQFSVPSVTPDTELIRRRKALIQLGEGLLLPCLMGLRAVLSKFSRNREKAQRLLLSQWAGLSEDRD